MCVCVCVCVCVSARVHARADACMRVRVCQNITIRTTAVSTVRDLEIVNLVHVPQVHSPPAVGVGVPCPLLRVHATPGV